MSAGTWRDGPSTLATSLKGAATVTLTKPTTSALILKGRYLNNSREEEEDEDEEVVITTASKRVLSRVKKQGTSTTALRDSSGIKEKKKSIDGHQFPFLMLLGGLDYEKGQVLSSIREFEAETETWMEKKNWRLTEARYGHTAILFQMNC